MKKGRWWLLIFFLTGSSIVKGDIDHKFFRAFQYVETIPEKLLSERSIVLISVKKENKTRSLWKELAKNVHGNFVAHGIDPVAYLNIQDVFAGIETQKYFSEDFIKREVKNLIILEHIDNRYILKVTVFNEKPTLAEHGQKAWFSQNTNLDEVLNDLKRVVSGSGQKKENFLMTDYPEFLEDTRMIKKQRYEIINQDLKLDKLAVPLFDKIVLPVSLPTSSIDADTKALIDDYQKKWENDSTFMATAMEEYPFKYGLVPADKDEQQLKNEGYQFVLYFLNTSGKVIRQMLNYKADKNVTDYITIKKVPGEKNSLVTIPAYQPVYKCYIKHIFSGEVYLGPDWDADLNWQEALKNHINGIKSAIKL